MSASDADPRNPHTFIADPGMPDTCGICWHEETDARHRPDAQAGASANAAERASGATAQPPLGCLVLYWIDIDHDLHVVIDGCPVIVRRPGGTVLYIAPEATALQHFEFVTRHPEAVRFDE